ncbi:scm-like with four MBT domains protein 1 [Saccostrea echinata]|uniref:scm-like with four MBT domains protein 1 n=1 Tax=Saccostrea echinata TaxID=191078 RepID=UPI002A8058AB|nr:scm-like with four MBT domains protein 1 [Saccostrea echinata]
MQSRPRMSGDRAISPSMLFPGTNPSLPSHIPIQMAAAPAQGYASSIVSTGPFPTPVIQNSGSRVSIPQSLTSQPSQNVFPLSPHSLGGQVSQTVFPAPLGSQACGSSGVYPTSVGSRLTHATVFPTLGSGGGIRQSVPTHYYAPGSSTPHLAVPMNHNLLHMSGGGIPQSPVLAYPGTPFVISGGQSPGMPGTSHASGHIQLLPRPPGTPSPATPHLLSPVSPSMPKVVGHIPITNTSPGNLNGNSGAISPCGNFPMSVPGGLILCSPMGASTLSMTSTPNSSQNSLATEPGEVIGQKEEKATDMSLNPAEETEVEIKPEDKTSSQEEVKACDKTEKQTEKEKSVHFRNMDMGSYNEDGVPVEYDDSDFVWEEYLDETGSIAVPNEAFKHVEYSLESGFVKGMKLEVPNKCNLGTYWVTSVIMTCGPLLRLRFDGYEEDSSADFWCDLISSEIHPIGWCAQNNQVLQPPEAIKDKFDDWREFLVKSLTGARTAPSFLLDKSTGTTPVDQLKRGMRLELQHAINPTDIWLVKIIENVGGRLYLRLEGAEPGSNDFWLFYLNHRLHPIGWAKTNGYKYSPPQELIMQFQEEVDWMSVLENALKESEKMMLPLAIFKDQEDIHPHRFKRGWKLEALNPLSTNQICPATVIKVLDCRYFVVEIDSLREDSYPIRFSCHSRSRFIFPCGWCQKHDVSITPPKGWHKKEFSWQEYLSFCNATPAPDFVVPQDKNLFEKGMKLEAVNPENPNQICAATVTKVVTPLVWIHLDNQRKSVESHIEHMYSHNLFPVGWCASNGYPIQPPRKLNKAGRPPSTVAEKKLVSLTDEAYSQMQQNEENSWCPKIYYNHKCFSGPYLSKGRIASLPKCVGPGPVGLVMKEVLSNLINVAYKSFRVLKELQIEGKSNPRMQQQTIKAKYKGKSYRAAVEICRDVNELDGFCRHICKKLECCPNLISPRHHDEKCPENCDQLNKTKYTQYFGKKIPGKVGRPPGGHTNLENGPKKPGKRGRKRKKLNILDERGDNIEREENSEEDRESVISDTQTVASNDSNENDSKKFKRKYTHHIPPPSDIKTRGAKLPKYSFERKTHKKILIPSSMMSEGSSRLAAKHHSSVTHKAVHTTSPEKKTIPDRLHLTTNPLKWSVNEVVKFLKTTDCANLARICKEQDIDGQALLLLTLPAVQEYMDLKLGPAVKFCHQIERVKLAFFTQYAK